MPEEQGAQIASLGSHMQRKNHRIKFCIFKDHSACLIFFLRVLNALLVCGQSSNRRKLSPLPQWCLTRKHQVSNCRKQNAELHRPVIWSSRTLVSVSFLVGWWWLVIRISQYISSTLPKALVNTWPGNLVCCCLLANYLPLTKEKRRALNFQLLSPILLLVFWHFNTSLSPWGLAT